LSASLQKRVPGVLTSATPQTKELNAEAVTATATVFLKRIGYKGGLKPKRVSFEEETYTVEVEMKKFTAIVRVDARNREIKEYEVQPKGEEGSYVSISPKTILMMFVVSAVVNIGLYFAFKMFAL